jgi:MFS family permease
MVITNHTNTTEPVRFHWTEYQRNKILGCIFWGYYLCWFVGGCLSEIYGSRIVLRTALLSAGLFTILTPLASYLNYYLLVATRVALGGGLGIVWPSVLPLAHSWIASADSSKFMSNTLSSQLRTALAWTVGRPSRLVSYFLRHWRLNTSVVGSSLVLFRVRLSQTTSLNNPKGAGGN